MGDGCPGTNHQQREIRARNLHGAVGILDRDGLLIAVDTAVLGVQVAPPIAQLG
jgi:hypothetical protein